MTKGDGKPGLQYAQDGGCMYACHWAACAEQGKWVLGVPVVAVATSGIGNTSSPGMQNSAVSIERISSDDDMMTGIGAAPLPAAVSWDGGSVLPLPAKITWDGGTVLPLPAAVPWDGGTVLPLPAVVPWDDGSVLPLPAAISWDGGIVLPLPAAIPHPCFLPPPPLPPCWL